MMKYELEQILLKGLALLIGAMLNVAVTMAAILSIAYDTIQPLLRVTGALAALCAVGFGGYFAVDYFRKRAQEAKRDARRFVEITDGA